MDSSTRLDHLTTWNEVCEALAFSSRNDLRPGGERDSESGAAPDSRPTVELLAEEIAWLALASKVQDDRRN